MNSIQPTFKLALVSILTSLYAVLFYLPIGFPIIGLEGARPISIAYFFALLLGLLFPPEISVSSVTLGGIIISILQFSPPFYILNFLPGTILALVSSLYFRDVVKPLLIYVILIFIYAFYPGGGVIYVYPYHALPHVAVLIFYSFVNLFNHFKASSNRKLRIVSAALIGSFAGQAMGTILFLAIYYGIAFSTPESLLPIWMFTLITYPIERIILALGGLVLYFGVREALQRFLEGYIVLPLNSLE